MSFGYILEKLKNKGKKVLFIIDEIINNSYVKVFASNFQIYITQNYPVYLVMAGLFDNISNLQNEKSLTFLYRAPKIFLEPLSIPAITTSYRSVFDISPSEAVEMAKLTKGYPFAFQILGYLKWETNDDLEKLLPKFDEELIIYAYEKIWSELSELDRKIVYVISTGVYKTGKIREKLSISPQLLNTYRKRLMERGVVNGSVRGELTLALPRFEEYIEMYIVKWSFSKISPVYLLYDNSGLIFILYIALIHVVFHLLEMIRISVQILLSHIILFGRDSFVLLLFINCQCLFLQQSYLN